MKGSESAPIDMMQHLLRARRVLLTGPIDPDGDRIAACLALQHICQQKGHANVDVAGQTAHRYEWLPSVDLMIADEGLGCDYDAVVILDGDRLRLTPQASRVFEQADFKGIIDHHASTSAQGYSLAWLDASSASTCEMLYCALPRWRHGLDQKMALLLYVGCIFDTGGFRYSNTSESTHKMAASLLAMNIDAANACSRILMERTPSSLRIAGYVYSNAVFHLSGRLVVGQVSEALAARLGIKNSDLEGIVDNLVFTTGVEVAALLTQMEPNKVKVSLRGRGRFDVASVARQLTPTGGGHVNAAGAMVPGNLQEVNAMVIRTFMAMEAKNTLAAPTGICDGQARQS